MMWKPFFIMHLSKLVGIPKGYSPEMFLFRKVFIPKGHNCEKFGIMTLRGKKSSELWPIGIKQTNKQTNKLPNDNPLE